MWHWEREGTIGGILERGDLGGGGRGVVTVGKIIVM